MNIDKISADIAAEYLYVEIFEICADLRSGKMSNEDAIVNFRYAMALCDVLYELDASKGEDLVDSINRALSDYSEDVINKINMPNWDISV